MKNLNNHLHIKIKKYFELTYYSYIQHYYEDIIDVSNEKQHIITSNTYDNTLISYIIMYMVDRINNINTYVPIHIEITLFLYINIHIRNILFNRKLIV